MLEGIHTGRTKALSYLASINSAQHLSTVLSGYEYPLSYTVILPESILLDTVVVFLL